MKCFSAGLLVLLFATSVAMPGAALAEETARVIVRFKPAADSVRAKAMGLNVKRWAAQDVAQTRATGLGLRTGRKLHSHFSLDERTHVITATGQSSAALARLLAQDSEVEIAVVDQRRRIAAIPNDPLYGGATSATPVFVGRFPDARGDLQDTYSRGVDQWYLKAPNGAVVSSINAPAAWDITTGAPAIVVAVLDTGVRKDHPDLAGQFVGGYDMVGLSAAAGQATANDGDRADSDASDPGDWVSAADISSGSLSGCDASDIANSSWHGTRVSGLIGAATNNGLGLAGVAWGVKILPVRVLGKCGGYDSDIMAGMRWAAGIDVPGVPGNVNPARVLNLSLGGTGACGASGTGALYRDTINQVIARGATVVVAAGNSAGEAVGLPGNCPGVIAVGALRHVGSKVGFSSVGPEVVIAAPGGNCINLATGYPCLYPMLSTTNSGTTTPVPANNVYTNSAASVGTSFSAPIVSGVVALMLSERPSLTAPEVIALLRRTVRPFVSSGGTAGTLQCVAPTSTEQLECYCTTSTCGAGMLDAGAAVAAAQAANVGESITITATPAGVTAGQTITLSAAGSTVGAGRTIASYAWVLVNGGGVVTGFASATNAVSTTLASTAAGTVVVSVQLTDDIGVIHTGSSSIVVAAAPPVTTSGSGGGAFSLAWLMGLLLAAVALKRPGMQLGLQSGLRPGLRLMRRLLSARRRA